MHRTSREQWGRKLCVVAGSLIVVATLPSCDSTPSARPDAVAHTEPAPAYATVAAAYNERVAHFDKFRARAVVRIKYDDENGKRHEEQGEGTLQVIRPDRLALSIKKAGSMLFWFGGDPERYWLFDVVDKPVVRVGRHDLIASHAKQGGAGLGLEINPREMIRLLGISPLPQSGKTAWSKDGRSVEITTVIPTGGNQVLAVEPQTYFPRRISLTDAAGKPVVTADLENFEPVELIGVGGGRPRAASRVTAVHPASNTEIKLDLAEMQNDKVIDKAFDFEELKRAMSVERVIDLDAPPPRAAGGGAPAP